MMHINRGGFTPDASWIQKAAQLTQRMVDATSRDEIYSIIDGNENVWGELKEPLLEKSHGKCWYSESKNEYAYFHVDHFRPKKAAIGKDKKDHGGYWWLTFVWENYRICGPVGNTKKRDKFAVLRNKANSPTDNIEDEIPYLLDPTEEEDVLKITFNSNGEIMPIHQIGFYCEQAKYTIECLNLNYKPLKESRKDIWIKCSRLLQETQNLIKENSQNPSVHKKTVIKEKIKQIKALVVSTAIFSATAKACLISTGIDWAISIAT